ncbi:MAG: CapA family protein [Candidatus Pacebacteria bacterium]|nr:CapA family protein [Candidatus Paceibacterota bacterium]MCF7862955.1 CapA family protein [Candidatus Paceibacterota bacterium]
MKLKLKYTFFILFSFLFGAGLMSGAFYGIEYIKNLDKKDISVEANVVEATKVETPKYYFVKEPSNELKVSAKAYLVGDLDTGEVIISKNEKDRHPIASVSKVMTAYVAKELSDEKDVATATKRALDTYGKNGNFRVGEKIKTNDLLYALLLESSNDASEILAEHFNRENFLSKMNQVAEKIELTDTYFKDPSGLSKDNQSTAFDLFKLVGYLHNEASDLFKITTQRNFNNKIHSWFSNNQFLTKEGYLGGKSGYTDPAKETVVSLFSIPLSENGNRNVAIALLQSNDRYKDVERILNFLKNNIYYGGKKDASSIWVMERAGVPHIKEPDFVTLLFAGDMMLDRGVKNSVNKNMNGDYAELFENLNILKEADITFANLEGPASDQGIDRRNLYSFRMNPETIPAIKSSGIDVLSVANNHAGDWGRDAFVDTLKRLKENEIYYTGGGTNRQEAEEPVIIEKYGMKIGYLGFSDVGPDWLGVNENAGILLAKDTRFGEIIKNASTKVDHLIVSFHFGDEYKIIHNTRQEYLAHKAIDNGAKLVIGHHPHVMQDTEKYKDGFIAYSMGNFIFDQGFSENTMQGMLLQIKLWRNGDIGTQKNVVKLDKTFKPDKVILGKEEEIKFKILKTTKIEIPKEKSN